MDVGTGITVLDRVDQTCDLAVQSSNTCLACGPLAGIGLLSLFPMLHCEIEDRLFPGRIPEHAITDDSENDSLGGLPRQERLTSADAAEITDAAEVLASGTADLERATTLSTGLSITLDQPLQQVTRIPRIARRTSQPALVIPETRHPGFGLVEQPLGFEERVVLDEAKLRTLAEVLRGFLGVSFDLPDLARDGITIIGHRTPAPDPDVFLVAQQRDDQRMMPVRLRRAMILRAHLDD